MAEVHQRVTAGRVEMGHPNHSTSHDPEIIMHTQLRLIKNCQKMHYFLLPKIFMYGSFHDAVSSSDLYCVENDRVINV